MASSAPPADSPAPAAAAPAPAAGTEPPSKSALKKAEKEAALAAKKALKKGTAAVQAALPKKEKKVVVAAPVEPDPEFIEVPEGHFKDLSQRMAAGYNPTDVEKSWYSWWRAQQFFVPALPSASPSEYSFYDSEPAALPRNKMGEVDLSKLDQDKVFVIPAPPPNVTGSLHIGHALAFGLQDMLIRWHRMRGFTTLYVPGYDHAGLSTQSVVEKKLMKDEGKTRHDLGREKFLEVCAEWKEEYQNKITNQIQRLGISCDWDRVAFTMSPELSKSVTENFVKLHEAGIIYRANRLVNWCVQMNTTLSNLEVDQKELAGRTELNVPGYPANEKFTFGVITSFAYQIEGSDEKIVIATTRPETMLGDTAIAVHPDDERYKHLHGKFAIHPFLERRIPIITDSEAVEMEFGTGAVKMTPAHDPNDYEVGMRHKLEFINILNDDGTLNANAGPMFKGMKRFHARVAVIEKLKERGLYVGEEDNPMAIPVCSKSGDIIEAVMKPQWWVSCKGMAEEAIKRTRAGELKIRPATSEAEWYRWLDTIQDWCISRQLWYSHRCPAYFVNVAGEERDRMDGENWIAARSLEEAQAKAEAKFPGTTFTLEQDEDVLDTWFSSGLWPFSIQGWPNETPDLKAFYPSTILETGWDILFFWVARMVMLGIKLTGQMPFSEVFCHAMIRDAHGRKMSKSLGNVIDPIDVIEGAKLEALHAQLRKGNLVEKEIALAEKGQKKDFPNGIPQCGTDALRFALANYSSGGRDINLEILRVEGYRKFCNKLWNATKFAMLKLNGDEIEGSAAAGERKFAPFVPRQSQKPTGEESLVEKWILQKLNRAAAGVNAALEERNFMGATGDAYNFWLYEVCDVYIEAIKLITDPDAPKAARVSAQNTLYTVLDNGLRLLHPFMPFVTEELWQRLPRRPTDSTKSIMVARFPEVDPAREFPEAEKEFDTAFAGIRAIRGIAAPYGLSSNLQVFFLARESALAKSLQSSTDAFKVLIKGCVNFTVVDKEADIPVGCVSENVSPGLAVYLLLKGVVNADNEIAKAEKKVAFNKAALDKLQTGFAAPDYATKKPEAVREREANKARELEIELESLAAAIASFMKLKD
ncbi:valyl-tRNA synthetase [Pseudohyphozyma bogoriensis]|nr:valyl-tRNA synthetase [Pseudohyphozyma bogoriensis]